MKTMLNTIERYIAGNSDMTDSMMKLLIETEGQECMSQQEIVFASQYAFECATLPYSSDEEQARINLIQSEFNKLIENH